VLLGVTLTVLLGATLTVLLGDTAILALLLVIVPL